METNEEKTRKQRGGRREGAGRKKQFSKLMMFKAPKEMAAYIEQFDNKSDYIKQCIAQDMERREAMERMDALLGIGNVMSVRDGGDEVPYYDNVRVAAGVPIGGCDTSVTEIGLREWLCAGHDDVYLVRVKGSSMIDANIQDGDMIAIDSSPRDYSEMDILLCEVDGEYTIKHVVVRGDVARLVPENKDFAVMEVDASALKVWGRVTAVMHRFAR